MPSRPFQAGCKRNPLKQGLEVIPSNTESTEVMQEYSGRTSCLGKNATKGWEDAATNKTMGLQDQSLGLLRELPLYGVLEPSRPTRIEWVSGPLRSHRDRDENGGIA
jgi:hypothetical protein